MRAAAAGLVLCLAGCDSSGGSATTAPAPGPSLTADPVPIPVGPPPCDTTPPPVDPTPAPVVEIGCSDWEEWHVGPSGRVRTSREGVLWFNNNVWRKEGALGQPFTQCLLRREVDGRDEYGWRWDWPRGDEDIKGYPEVIHGWKPWNPPTMGPFPLRISDVQQLEVSFDAYLVAEGFYNMAFSMWITSENPPSPGAITHEIMIWTDRSCDFLSGRFVGEAEIEERTYSLVVNEDHHTGDWTYISFTAHEDQFSGTLNLRRFLNFLVEEGHVPADHYVADVELGNEANWGTGEMWLKHYEVQSR